MAALLAELEIAGADDRIRTAVEHHAGRLAIAGSFDRREGLHRLVEGAARVAPDEPDRAMSMLLDAWTLALRGGSRDQVRDVTAQAASLAGRVRQELADEAEVLRLCVEAFDGDDGAAPALVGQARALLDSSGPLGEAEGTVKRVVAALSALSRYHEAREVLEAFIMRADAAGAQVALPTPTVLLALTAFALDDWVSAEALAVEALDRANRTGRSVARGGALMVLALVGAARGDVAGTHRRLRRAAEIEQAYNLVSWEPTRVYIPGLLALGQGDPGSAISSLEETERSISQRGIVSPGALRWEGDYLEVMARAGRHDEARAMLDRLRQRAGRVPVAWEAVAVLRGRVLMGDAPDLKVEPGFLGGADAEYPFEAARLCLCWGEHLEASGRVGEAADAFDRALTGFTALGAPGWVRQAQEHLNRPRVGKIVVAPDPDQPRVSCSVLGRFEVNRDGRTLDLPGLAGKLVAMLAIRGAAPADDVTEALWPEGDLDRAGARLRKVVHRVRGAASGLVVRSGDTLRLADGVDVDAARFESAARRALSAPAGSTEAVDAAREAFAEYGGDLLPGLPYEEWTIGPRSVLQRRYVDVLDLLVAEAAARGEVEQMSAYLNRGLDAHPYDESRYVRGARFLAGAGRADSALALLERAREAMGDLGVPLSAEAAALEDSLRGD
jgi:DNA-binding SARP family transcriptional activator